MLAASRSLVIAQTAITVPAAIPQDPAVYRGAQGVQRGRRGRSSSRICAQAHRVVGGRRG